MNQNCLVTKLKASVNDITLVKLGGFIIKVKAASEGISRFYASADAPVTLTSSNNYPLTCNGITSNEIILNDTTDVKFPAGEYIVNVGSNYKFDGCVNTTTAFEINLNDVKYQTKARYILTGSSGTLNGDISNIKDITGLLYLLGGNINHNLYGDIANLPNTLYNIKLSYSEVTGDIASLDFVSFPEFKIELSLLKTNVYGTLESVVEKLRQKQSNGSITFNVTGTNVTLGGSLLSRASASRVGILWWDATGIAYINGSDDNVSNGAAVIYVKNVNSTQVSEWSSLGNTIIEV